MTQRRTSRGTPAMLTKDEQNAMVRLLDNNPALIANIETLIGKKLDSMTFGEKLKAISEFMEMGRSLTPFNAAARAMRDLSNLAQDERGEVALADKVVLLEAQITSLREQLAKSQERESYLRTQLTELSARPAMAVHSEQKEAS